MDGIYRHQRFIYDGTRKFYLLGRDRLIGELDVRPGQKVLEVACGTGRNLAAIGARYPGCRLYGIDISAEMLKSARATMRRARIGGRVSLAQGDACSFVPAESFDASSFDRIVFSYSLSMIPDWRAALGHALAHLAPGGSLAVVDFGAQAGLRDWFGRVLRAWLARFHVTPRAELEGAMQGLAGARALDLEFRRLYGDYAHYAVLRDRRPPLS